MIYITNQTKVVRGATMSINIITNEVYDGTMKDFSNQDIVDFLNRHTVCPITIEFLYYLKYHSIFENCRLFTSKPIDDIDSMYIAYRNYVKRALLQIINPLNICT